MEKSKIAPDVLKGIASRDLSSYPYSETGLTPDSARALGLAETARIFVSTDTIASLPHAESGMIAMLRNIFPEEPQQKIRSTVSNFLYGGEESSS